MSSGSPSRLPGTTGSRQKCRAPKIEVNEVSHSQRLEDPAPHGCAAPPAARLPGCSRRPAAGGRPHTWTGPCAQCAAPPPRTLRAAFPPDTPLHIRAHALGLLTSEDVIIRCRDMRAGLGRAAAAHMRTCVWIPNGHTQSATCLHTRAGH